MLTVVNLIVRYDPHKRTVWCTLTLILGELYGHGGMWRMSQFDRTVWAELLERCLDLGRRRRQCALQNGYLVLEMRLKSNISPHRRGMTSAIT